METQIKEVQEYFKAKILDKDFEIKSIDEYIMTITIDGNYDFKIWLGNFDNQALRFIIDDSFMTIELNDAECTYLHNLIAGDVKSYRFNELLKKKQFEVESLQRELNNEN